MGVVVGLEQFCQADTVEKVVVVRSEQPCQTGAVGVSAKEVLPEHTDQVCLAQIGFTPNRERPAPLPVRKRWGSAKLNTRFLFVAFVVQFAQEVKRALFT